MAVFFSNLARKPIRSLKTLIPNPSSSSSSRSYISDMRRSAFKENLLRILRTEITYASTSSPTPPLFPPPASSFSVDDRPGEQWVRLTRTFAGAETVKVDATMIDGAVPERPRSGGGGAPLPDAAPSARLHISLIVEVSKGDRSDRVLQAVCSAWPDALDVQKVYTFSRIAGERSTQPFLGPNFEDLDEELQSAVRDYLEERGVNDELAEFLHRYMESKDSGELLRWLKNVEAYVKE
ncbi:Uncharacterized protein M6B38_223155 [Iris pallida]|uniref:Mitochondrial glycoprotein n=1 Tax=Iris pallida TaxID=29817 RepID=A0AAX6DX72_IRIPA|nr:Uncharacterized protein M6B38_221680 [Iris pallida]KAJ6796301.1 Uncharacterized protein M6B38_223155 [Iris pallida]